MPSGHLVNEAETRLRKWLETTSPKPGTRLPSERALAVQLDLQHYALNRAMGRLIAEGHLERVGYKLFVSGQTRTPHAFTCHLVIALRSIYLSSYRRVAKEMGIKLVVHPWQSTDEFMLILDRLDARETDAVVLDPPFSAPVTLWEPITNRLCQHGIAVACIGQTTQASFNVTQDHVAALQLAIAHLTELGHHEIGLIFPSSSNDIMHAWGEMGARYGLVHPARRVHQQGSLRRKEEIDEVTGLLTGDWNTVTALIVLDPFECNIQMLQEQLSNKGRPVPSNLALLFIGDGKAAATAIPPVSSISFDMAAMHETAFYFAQRAVRKKKAMGFSPPACSVRIQPHFIQRNSTGSPASPNAKLQSSGADTVPAPAGKSISLLENAHLMEAQLRKAYPLAMRASLSERPRFAPVDLGPYVNRPLNFRRGWLGDLPLKQFPPGPHEIHGVPFQILGGPSRSDCGAIVFHSATNTIGNAHRLPEKVTIPIRSKVQAVYILHGCGYAKTLHAFARYDFHSRKSCVESIPLVSMGMPSPEGNPRNADANTGAANIQDWWPDYPHEDFPHARMAPIQETISAGNLPRYVFLYTLEWINPFPQTIVSHLEISADPTVSTTLGVLAVTVLKP